MLQLTNIYFSLYESKTWHAENIKEKNASMSLGSQFSTIDVKIIDILLTTRLPYSFVYSLKYVKPWISCNARFYPIGIIMGFIRI